MNLFKKFIRATVTLMVVILFFSAFTNNALAHATLEKQSPNESEIVKTAPETIQLEFNEPVYTDYSKMMLYDDQGSEVATLKPEESGKAQTLHFDASKVKEGTYQVSWEAVSLDGHEVDGQYYFSVGKKTADTIDTSGPFYTDAFFWFGLVRFLLQASLLILTGLYIVNWLMDRQKVPTYHVIPHHRSAIVLLMMGAFTAAIVYLMTLPETVITQILKLDFSVWLQFPFIISMLSLIVVLALFTLKNMEMLWYKVMPLFILLSLAISGHVWTQEMPLYSILLRTVHLFGIAIWLGSLTYLVAHVVKHQGKRHIATIKNILLKLNILAVVLIILTGLLMSIDATSIVSIVTASTAYSGLWFAKIGLTIVMMMLGALQTFWAMKQHGRVHRPLLYIELVIGICLILAGVIMSQIQIPL
ncbi:copper resistance CopC/CopD family protein [Staphylococcus lutrae]|uniref:CopC domain-containing protein n=1 Tax=Staphylococcus lutrae TaxID=155085 RepID=A0AAC9RTL2_9STAP|nr:copper resistance protein CopC [Staphylococcus lutrae]ARJ50525.1 hypothetical protein B5P37_03960 [Staphylococcus lutrae]PNZ37427.1 hypothetical protein CD134_06515 [Staphylococcus lutrae]